MRSEAVRPQESERGPVERAPVNRRTAYAWRTRNAGAAAVGTVGAGVLALARLVMLVASLIALLIALAIVLRDVDANAGNTIVKGIHEGANFFAGAFTGLIRFNGHPKRAITVDSGHRARGLPDRRRLHLERHRAGRARRRGILERSHRTVLGAP